MNTLIAPRLGAASGIVFAVVLFAGSGHSSPGQVVRELAAVVIFLPFLAYLCSVLREAEGPRGWLTMTAFAAGLAGITIKLLTGMPVIALQHVPSGTPLHRALDDMSSASTVISLYPFAVMLASIAVYFFVIFVVTFLRPQAGPRAERVNWAERWRGLYKVWGVVALFLMVMGGITFGIFTTRSLSLSSA